MKIERYKEFLRMIRPWEWPEAFFSNPEKVQSMALAIQDYAKGVFMDSTPMERPLGLLTVRLLWELAELSHDKRRRQELAEAFAVGDELTFYWSLATPWGVRNLTDTQVDDFLKVAVVLGDGLMSQAKILGTRKAGVRERPVLGLTSRRGFDAAWAGESDALRDLLGGDRPKLGLKDELTFAIKENDALGIFHCGLPWFGAWDDPSLKEVKIPRPLAHIAPDVFEKTDPSGTRFRWFLPGSEMGARIELEGHVTLVPEGIDELSKAFADEAPCIRVQFGYVPGWYVVPYGLSREVYVWSDAGQDLREEVEAGVEEITNL